MNSKILLLDDDQFVHVRLSELLDAASIDYLSFFNAADAERYLIDNRDIVFAVVDLFLEGEKGDQLSNSFIENVLHNKNIPYCRLTSAPRMVPRNCSGVGIFDKRLVFRNPENLIDTIKSYL